MWSIFISVLASLIKKIGLAWWAKHEADNKDERIADAPITDNEEAEYWNNQQNQ